MSTWTNILDLVYPVGAVYTSNSGTSPATLFGGTWTQLKEKFIFAAGTTYKASATGGATTVTLATDQIPSHTHSYPVCWMGEGSTLVTTVYVTYRDSGYSNNLTAWNVSHTGGGKAHNNMPPYQVFYVWYRTA